MNTAAASTIALISLFATATALAQSAVTATPASVHPTAAVTIAGTKFGDSEAVDVYVDTFDTLLLVSSATGTINGSVTVPVAAPPGQHYITAIGRHSGDAAQIAFTVTTPWVESGFGAAHLGWNPYENVLSPSNAASLGPLWDASINTYGATPVVTGGRVYLTTSAGIESVSAATGKKLWTSVTNQGFYASPAVSGGVLYVGGSTANFYALTATTGAIKWTTALGSSVISSAVVVGDVVYFGCEDAKVYALSTTTGAVLWTYKTGALVDSSPAVVDGVLYIGSTDDYVYALNATTGALIWSYKTDGPVESTPAVSKGIVYVGSDDDYVYAIRAKGANAGTVLWTYQTGDAVYQTPAVANNTVFIGSSDGNLYALDAAAGYAQWSLTTNGNLGNAAVANGVVYATSRDGSFYVVDASYGGIYALFETGATYFGSPSVSNGIVYLSTSGPDTYAFAVDAGTSAVRSIKAPLPSSLHPDFDLHVTEQK